MKKDTVNGIVMIILIIITLASAGYSVLQYTQTEERKEKDAATIQNQLDVIMQSNFIIGEHEKKIAELEEVKNSAVANAQQYKDSLDGAKQIIADFSNDIEDLKDKIKDYETVATVEGNLEEQYDIFIDWTDSYEFTFNLELVDEIKEFNQDFIQVPTLNMIAANAIYYNKINLIDNYINLTETQDKQIENYQTALYFSQEESSYHQSAFNKSELINIELRGTLKQERRRTRAFQIITGVLVSYIVYDTLIK
jgi:archaellum component FlaC